MRAPYLLTALLLSLSCRAQSVPEPSTYAGTPEPDVVLGWLHSPDPRLQAWAAHDILVYRLADLLPKLQTLLEQTTPATLSDAGRLVNFRTTLAILDTLIQLGTTVPAATLARVEKLGYNSETEELILLSRLPWDKAESGIHSFYKRSLARPDLTRVSAQLLAQHSSRGFAAEVLSTIVVSCRITVRDLHSGAGGVGSGLSSCCGTGSGAITADWPEIGRYSFQDPPRNGQVLVEDETLFLPAPDPVYLLRTVGRTYSPRVCGGLSPLNDAIRSHLIGTLLGGAPSSPFPEKPLSLDILYESRESYRARVQGLVDQNLANFNRITAALTARDVLTEQERQAAALRIDLSVQDIRAQPAEDLPVIAFRPPVQWVDAF